MKMKYSIESQQPLEIAFRSDASVMITGPTGSGKTRLARTIHERGARKSRPFVTINLSSVHAGTLESELFGHERGAFTGADQRRIGRLESANGGTVFLDEIGELPLHLQARLLEFLQSKVIVPLGSNREVRLDVRVIAATHKDLEHLVQKKEFRADLLHRLRVICIEMPSIIARADDFDCLVHEVLEEVCRDSGHSILSISEEAATRLEEHDWPGNFRELRNVLEFAVLSSSGSQISARDLPPWFASVRRNQECALGSQRLLGVAEFSLTLDYAGTLSRFEQEYLRRALAFFRGRVNQTARAIGMNKSTLIRRMKAYGLQTSRNEALDALRDAEQIRSERIVEKNFSNVAEKHCAVELR
jgi:DNA-binding NtrC family response regulator